MTPREPPLQNNEHPHRNEQTLQENEVSRHSSDNMNSFCESVHMAATVVYGPRSSLPLAAVQKKG